MALPVPVSCINTEPAVASMSSVLDAVLSVMSPAAPKVTSPAVASTLTAPALVMADWTVTAPAALKRKLPLALMPTAELASLTLKSPEVTCTTKASALCKPAPLVATAVCACATPPALTRLTTTDTLPVLRPALSVMKAPPLPADSDKVSTEVSSASLLLPTAPAVPVLTYKARAVTSTALSPSTTEPPACKATWPALLLI